MSRHSGISGSGRAELGLIVGRGRRIVSVADVAATLQINSVDAAKRLARWAKEGWLRRVQRGLYIPVPLDAENPATWSEDPLILADAVWNPCYFTGWTAANHWGLTEQIFHTTVLKTSGRVRSVRARLLDHQYLLAHAAPELMVWGMRNVWREERKVLMADPARTAIDILDNPQLGGGIRHCADVLARYLDEHDPSTLIEYGERLSNRAVFKRLGYVVEIAGLKDGKLLMECRKRISAGISLLDPSAPFGGERIGKWGLRANAQVARPDHS